MNDLASLFVICLLGSSVSSQDANLTIVSNPKYQQQPLKFGCSPTQPSSWALVSSITLSKTTPTRQDIVTVILQTSPTIQNKTTWFNDNWRHRSVIVKQYIQPVDGSGIEFDISEQDVLYSDEGTYICRVSGSTFESQNIVRTDIKTLSFTDTSSTVTAESSPILVTASVFTLFLSSSAGR